MGHEASTDVSARGGGGEIVVLVVELASVLAAHTLAVLQVFVLNWLLIRSCETQMKTSKTSCHAVALTESFKTQE